MKSNHPRRFEQWIPHQDREPLKLWTLELNARGPFHRCSPRKRRPLLEGLKCAARRQRRNDPFTLEEGVTLGTRTSKPNPRPFPIGHNPLTQDDHRTGGEATKFCAEFDWENWAVRLAWTAAALVGDDDHGLKESISYQGHSAAVWLWMSRAVSWWIPRSW